MDSFVSSAAIAAPVLELIREAARIEDSGHETLDDSSGFGMVESFYDLGPLCTGVWFGQMMNVKEEFMERYAAISFYFCPDAVSGWSNAQINIKMELGKRVWTIRYDKTEPKEIANGRERKVPVTAQQWYIDAARRMLSDLGIDEAAALQERGAALGDTVEVLPMIRKASDIFLQQSTQVPFNYEDFDF